jgi:hypothetical protein
MCLPIKSLACRSTPPSSDLTPPSVESPARLDRQITLGFGNEASTCTTMPQEFASFELSSRARFCPHAKMTCPLNCDGIKDDFLLGGVSKTQRCRTWSGCAEPPRHALAAKCTRGRSRNRRLTTALETTSITSSLCLKYQRGRDLCSRGLS